MSSTVRSLVLVVAGVFGAWMLYQTFGSSRVTGGTVLLYFLIGLVVLAGAALWQYRYYAPGEDTISRNEVPAQDPTWARFLSRSTLAAPIWLGIRLFLAYDWLLAGYHKLIDPKWFVTGESLMSSWTRSVTPAASGAAPTPYEFFRNFLQMLLDTHAYTWFSKLVIFGELAVGLGLLFGALTGFAAAGGILMNTSYLFAGTLSSNPLLLLLEILIVWAWRSASWLGIDRVLLPYLGVPGAPHARAPAQGRVAPSAS